MSDDFFSVSFLASPRGPVPSGSCSAYLLMDRSWPEPLMPILHCFLIQRIFLSAGILQSNTGQMWIHLSDEEALP